MSHTMFQMLAEKRQELKTLARSIIDRAETEKRELTGEESSRFEQITADLAALDARESAVLAEQRSGEQNAAVLRALGGDMTEDRSAEWVNADTGARAAVRAGESFASHEVAVDFRARQEAADSAVMGQHGDLGNLVRSLTTSGGSAIVPSIWAAGLIDLARNKSAVMQAGATLVPMGAKTVNIGRLTGDPTSSFRTEGSAITPSDPTFDNVVLDSKTQSALVIGSLEWFQDAENADTVVKNAIASAMAQRIDLVALYGGITSGAGTINLPTPPNPRGILAALNATKPANVLGAAANGTTQTAGSYWGEILDLIFTVRDSNEEPNALIWNSKLGRQYAKANDTTGQPLSMPADVAAMARFSSNQVPSYTQGTMTGRATDVFAGDFTQLLVGQRLGVTIQVLTERYADNGQIGIVAHWRGDVQPARPGAFAVYRSIQGAS